MPSRYEKTIVCLANSRKLSGRCIAGKEVTGRGYAGWIRPVSPRATGEIALSERRFENGQTPALLDTITIPMVEPVPHAHQVENHKIAPEYWWRKSGSVPWAALPTLVDKPSTLWMNYDSTRPGTYDRVGEAFASAAGGSLYLIHPEDVTIQVLTPSADYGNPKRAVRADFVYNGVHYNFAVTDMVAEQTFLAKPNGEYDLNQDVYFTISLGEAYNGACYKLVAAVIARHAL